MERVSGRKYRFWCSRVPRAGSHRCRHHAQLWLHQRDVGHRRGQPCHLPDRPADLLLRRASWRGHGPAGTGCGVRLPWLHRHLADLRQLHLYLFRARGGHHGAGIRAAVRSAEVHRLPAVRHRGHPAGHPWRDAAVAYPALDPAAVARAADPALWADPVARAAALYRVSLAQRAPGRWRRFLMGSVRRRRHGGRRADRADRRTGGLPALHAAAHAGQPRAMVGGVDCGRTGLDHPWCGQDGWRSVSRLRRTAGGIADRPRAGTTWQASHSGSATVGPAGWPCS